MAWDNATIHKTKIIRELLVEHKMGLLTMKPYSPWLNPAEGYIASIKKKIRTQLERSKLLTKTFIKDWIKEAWNGDPERFVEALRKNDKDYKSGKKVSVNFNCNSWNNNC